MNRRVMNVALLVLAGLGSRLYGFDFDKLNVDKAIDGGSKVVKAASGISEQDEIAIG